MENKCNIKSGKQTGIPDILENARLKANPFTLPEGYFRDVEDRLQDAIHNPGKEESPTLSSLRTTLAMVAMFALVFGLAYGIFSITGTGNNPAMEETAITSDGTLATTGSETGKEAMSDEELLQYYGSYDAYSAETLEAINVVPHTINKDEIEQYLIDSNVPSLMVLAALE